MPSTCSKPKSMRSTAAARTQRRCSAELGSLRTQLARPPGDAARVAPAARRSSKNGCRRSASSSTISRSAARPRDRRTRDRGDAGGAGRSDGVARARRRRRLARGSSSSNGSTGWMARLQIGRRFASSRRACPSLTGLVATGCDRARSRRRRPTSSDARAGHRPIARRLAEELIERARAPRRARRRSRRRDRVRVPVRRASGSCSRSASTSTDGRLDARYYDTLASEARLASFVAIATGKCRTSTGSSSAAR